VAMKSLRIVVDVLGQSELHSDSKPER